MKPSFLTLTAIFLSLNGADSRAEGPEIAPGPDFVTVGNTLIRQDSIETVIKGIVARIINADVNGSVIRFGANGMREVIPLEPKDDTFREVLELLGIKEKLSYAISPLQVRFSLPEQGLKINIKPLGADTFEVKAKWQIDSLKVSADRLSIKVPKGLFDHPFEIESKPIRVGMKEKSAPFRFELGLITMLKPEGLRIKIESFSTNILSRTRPEFFLTLGPLTVLGKPLSIDIASGSTVLHAGESEIRAELQKLEPEVVSQIRARIAGAIEENLKLATRRAEEAPPLKYTVSTDDLLRTTPTGPAVKELIGGITGDFIFSYLHFSSEANLFSTEISSKVCFDGRCLGQDDGTTPIGVPDLNVMGPKDGIGIVLQESFIRTLVHTAEFQSRIQRVYQMMGPSPGVSLSEKGVRVGFDPRRNSIVAVLNLEIDIKKTVRENTPFGERLRLGLGDLIEQYFGSGKIVKIPVEVDFNLIGIYPDNQGRPNVLVTSSLPFDAKGNYIAPRTCSLTQCPSNVEKMTSIVKKGFMASVRRELLDIIKPSILIPIGQTLQVQNFEFHPKFVRITPNRGLLISADLTDEGKLWQ
jgi:hypothetical protein